MTNHGGTGAVSWTTLGLAFSLVTGCNSAPPKKPEAKQLGDYAYAKQYATWLIEQQMRRHGVVGLSIALVDDQRIVWAQGFGYADKAAKIAATSETIYRVGSISKLFTATAAMQLAEQGKLDIDRPLQDYVPEFSIKTRYPKSAPITPRNLMTHHSGLPGGYIKGMWNPKPTPFAQLVELTRDLYAAYPPDYLVAYSNVGVTLLGHALERVSGEPFAEHLGRRLLRPLGLEHSEFSTAVSTSPLMSKGYGDGKEVLELPLRDVPAGGLNSNVLDMSRFLHMVFAKGQADGNRILRAATLEEMLRPQNTGVAMDRDVRVGLGWMLSGVGIRNAGTVAGHGGATLAFIGHLIALPEHKLGVVVLTNTEPGGAVATKLAEETLKLALEAKTGIQQPQPDKTLAKAAELTPAERQAYTGSWTTEAGLVTVSGQGNTLRAEAFGKTFQLIPRTDGRLRLQYKLLGVIPIPLGGLADVGLFHAEMDGRHLVIARQGEEERVFGERISPEPIPAPWVQRVGDYEIVNLGGDFPFLTGARLAIEKGALTSELSGSLPMPPTVLKPINNREAIVLGTLSDMGETVTVVVRDGEEMLVSSGYLFKKKPGQ